MKKGLLIAAAALLSANVYAAHPLQGYKAASLCGSNNYQGGNSCLSTNGSSILKPQKVVKGKDMAWVFRNVSNQTIRVGSGWSGSGYRGCRAWGAVMSADLSKKLATAVPEKSFQIPPKAALVFSEKYFKDPKWGACGPWDMILPTQFGEIEVENM